MSKAVAKKRKRGPDKEIAEAFFQSPELGSSRLRPRKDIPSFHRVLLSVNDFERIVGKRIKVFWPDSRRWFLGKIKSFDNEKKLHRVFYDDGDKEELNLMTERFELEIMPSEGFTIFSRSEPNREIPDNGGESRDIINEGSRIIDDAVTQVIGHPKKSEGVQIAEAHNLEKQEASEPVKRYARIERTPSKASKKRHPKLQGGKDTDTEGNLALDAND
ncbi:DNA mismatch repair protein MSH6, partial [Telopea speciosissima]|uniref:DNA mismatch repair protein MSH6 n=1 Tax=Telopea speciosissima TaxID=54955 RepID=UPI001CC4886F